MGSLAHCVKVKIVVSVRSANRYRDAIGIYANGHVGTVFVATRVYVVVVAGDATGLGPAGSFSAVVGLHW